MKIGTVRPEEAKVRDTHAGYHQFHAEVTQEPFGSFEIFWHEPEDSPDEGFFNMPAGWYWAAGWPGCLWDSEPQGPFASSFAALEDADEWNPLFD